MSKPPRPSSAQPPVTKPFSSTTLDESVDLLVDEQVANEPAVETGSFSEEPAISTQVRHLVIRASAGSGKTYQLAIRYLRRLLDGVPAEQILASTFTRKAAGEILARILARLAIAARDDKELRKLAAHLGAETFDRQRCLELLAELTQSLHRLRIGTLDSFFARLATSYTLELGLPPGWQIIDELADARLRRQAVEQVLREGSTSEIRRLTNLLSKGDSGRRVSAQIQTAVKDFYNVYLNTDAVAWRRFPDLVPLSSTALAETIEQLRTVELPDHKSVQKERLKDCAYLAEGDWPSFIRTGIAAKLLQGESTYNRVEIPPAACAVYGRLLDHVRAIETSILAERTAATYELLAAFDAAYRRLKHDVRGLRFEDVTQHLAAAFGVGGSSAEAVHQLAYRLDSDVTHLLLDEFQDTSLAQWEVMRPFAERITRADGDTSFFCVGDVKQAIYGWRGGVAEIFDAIDQQLEGVQTAKLARSFRSSKVVIDVVNELFQNLTRHPNLKQDAETIRQWCAAVEPHTTAKDLPGHVTLETGPPIEDGGKTGLPDVTIRHAAVRTAQIAQSAPGASVGVLVRTNQHIPQLVAVLRRLGVEASEEAGSLLNDSAAVVVLLSLLQLADHPGDTTARFHVATSPLGEALDFSRHDDDERAAQLAADARRALLDDGYGPTLDAWARLLIPSCGRRDVTRLGQLVGMAYRFGEQSTLRPTDFVRFVELNKVDDPSSARVRVMNVHQAKGLQFDAVVLALVSTRLIAVTPQYVTGGNDVTAAPDLVSRYCDESAQRLLPTEFQEAFASTRSKSIREELCILYVAVTRAVHALHIIVPPSVRKEQTLSANSATLVRAALTDGGRAEPISTLFERGQSDWAAQAGLAAESDSDSKATEPASSPILRVSLAPMTEGRSRGLGRVAPSQAATSQRVRMSQLVKGPKSAALDRGSLIHAWFEQIEWLDDGPPAEDRLRHIAGRMGFAEDESQRHLNSFRAMLERPAVSRLLSQSSYLARKEPPLAPPVVDELSADPFTLDVSCERPVAARLEGELLIGTIDRLVLLRRGLQIIAADILDYKTDSVAQGDVTALDRTAHYRRQLESYSAAVSLIYRLPRQRITARLLFVESGQVVTV